MSYTASVITVSDKCSIGERIDTSGPAVCQMLRDAGFQIVSTAIVPDDAPQIREELLRGADELRCDLIVTTGGTGLSPRDITPDVTRDILDREIPAIPQAMLFFSLRITSRAMLSRAVAGVRKHSLILNLPGSEKAARENLGAIVDTLDHALKMLGGGGH